MKLLVLDGNSIINRAFYGIKLLTTKDGQYTNAIYGFLTTFIRLLGETEPDAVAVAFDLKAPTFRHKAYSGYKANRHGMPDELASQMEPLKEILKALGYKIVTCEGFEADDILGTLAKECTDKGYECVIATGDRDSLQLVSPSVTVRIASTKFGKPEVTLYDEEKIMEVYGVAPSQLIDIKAIQGDTSDCIPGVKGIGEKGANELVAKYHDLDYIYQHLEELDIKPAMKKKLTEGKDSAYMSRMLGTISTEAPIDRQIDSYIPSARDEGEAARLLGRLEMFKLIEKLGLSGAPIKTEKTEQTVHKTMDYDSDPDTSELLSRLHGKTVDALFTVDKLNKDSFSEIELCDGDCVYLLNSFMDGFSDFCRGLFEDNTIRLRTDDSKAVYSVLEKNDIECDNIVFDLSLAAYLLNPNSSDYSVSMLAKEYEIQALPCQKECQTALFSPLADRLVSEIEKKQQSKLLSDIELPLSRVLASMENAGFKVNSDSIAKYGADLQQDAERLKKSIYDRVGYEFNINSPKQLGVALFEKLGLPAKKKTKSGYSTNADVLEELRRYDPVIDEILEYRTVTKLKSTYCDGLLKVIQPDGRIHTSFRQTETRTGRISSTEPNLQNIPVRTQRGREFRKFFAAEHGCVLVDADYSQIELRVLAHIADDKNMTEAFITGQDIHRSTAAKVFDMPDEFVTSEMRSRAKAVNFGIVYGISAFSLSKDIGVTRKEADKYIKDYLALYSGIDNYMKQTVEQAKKDGYVTTMFGRRRYLPELLSSNFTTRSFGERVARNMPIQGTAADIIKIAMIRVYNRLKKEKMKSRLILQVHDELIVESPENEAQKAAKILSEEMQNAAALSVPLTADAGIGKTWYEAKV